MDKEQLKKKIDNIIKKHYHENSSVGKWYCDWALVKEELTTLINRERAEAELALLESLNKEIVARGEPNTFEVGRRYVLEYSERVKVLKEYLSKEGK